MLRALSNTGREADNTRMNTMNLPYRARMPWLVLAAVLALGGCVVAPEHSRRYESEEIIYGPTTSTYVLIAPPAPRVEYRGYPPAVGYLWIEGYWSWGGVRYVWVPGRWVAPRPGYVWIPHRWDRDGDRWRHDGGRWEPDRRNPSPRHERGREHMRDGQPWSQPPVQPPPQHRLEPRPQVWPAPVPGRARPDADGRDDDERRDNGRRPGAASPMERATPRHNDSEVRQRDPRWPNGTPETQRRAEPRSEVQRPSERSQRDPRDPHRREREEEWRKEREKGKQD